MTDVSIVHTRSLVISQSISGLWAVTNYTAWRKGTCVKNLHYHVTTLGNKVLKTKTTNREC